MSHCNVNCPDGASSCNSCNNADPTTKPALPPCGSLISGSLGESLAAFAEILAYGATSVQVMRRMRALIKDLIAVVPAERRAGLEEWQAHLRRIVAASFADADDRTVALIEDRQGLGVSRRRSNP